MLLAKWLCAVSERGPFRSRAKGYPAGKLPAFWLVGHASTVV